MREKTGNGKRSAERGIEIPPYPGVISEYFKIP